MARSLSEIEHRCLQAAREAVLDRRLEGRMFDGAMMRQGEIVALRAILRTLYELPPQVKAVAENGAGDFEERWQRAIDLISPPDES